jgi:acetyl-CoA C-acetyltransferase
MASPKHREPDPRAPVIVGAAQLASPAGAPDGPIGLAVEALRRAAQDSGSGEQLLRRADAVGHVATLSWPYTDEAALIASGLGLSAPHTVRTAQLGGDGPGLLVSEMARAIAAGELDVALLSGAEAIAALRAAQKAGALPDWPSQDSAATPAKVLGTDRPGSSDGEMAVGLAAPVYVYALLETAIRARVGDGRGAHQREVAQLWSRFSDVAADNPNAALRRRVSVEELLARTSDNRPVSEPYTKLLTANAGVDQATGMIMCSAHAAAAAGIEPDRWVFVLAAAHAHDEWFVSERAELPASPAIRAMGRAALEHAGLTIDEVKHIDLYSCFPSAVQIAASELGIAPSDGRALTVTGGLTFAGGPGNNYSSHAIATLVERLREEPDTTGLSTALGWYATKHAAVVLSGSPGKEPFRLFAPSFPRPSPRRASIEHIGTATVEAYTVPYARDGSAEAAIVSALAPDGTRALARTTQPDLVGAVLTEDPLGRTAEISGARLEGLS